VYHHSAPNRERGVLWWACVCVCVCVCVCEYRVSRITIATSRTTSTSPTCCQTGRSKSPSFPLYFDSLCSCVAGFQCFCTTCRTQVYLQQTDVTEFEPMTKNLRKSAKFRIRHKAGLSYASETQQLSYVRWLTPHPPWSCCGAVDSQWRADLQHTLATQRLRERCSRKRQISDLRFFYNWKIPR